MVIEVEVDEFFKTYNNNSIKGLASYAHRNQRIYDLIMIYQNTYSKKATPSNKFYVLRKLIQVLGQRDW